MVRAIQIQRFGAPEVLEVVTLARPKPESDQVLIEVEAAGITFVETQLRAGRAPRAEMTPELPVVLGNGVGGTVRALGAGADRGLQGQRVVARLKGRGGYAEYAVADTASVVVVPDGLALDEATALLADGRTARAVLASVHEIVGDAPMAGVRVLVAPAAGGVGTLLVPLLAREDAVVVAAAGGPRKLDLARSRGADVTIDYGDHGWTEAVRDEVGQVDVLLDGVGAAFGDGALPLLAPGGLVCRFGAAGGALGPDPSEAGRPDVRVVTLGPVSQWRQREWITDALRDANSGGIHPVIGQRFALDRAAAAHRVIEGRNTTGKTLLEPELRASGEGDAHARG